MRWEDEKSTTSSSSLGLRKSAKTKGRKKKLSWNDERNATKHITHLDDIPEDEVNATWYDATEYSEIKAGYQLTIFMMEAGETLKTEEHTSRGLEYRTQEGAWARYENKRDAYNAVLDEQDRQWQEDCDDHVAISKIYLQHSTKCAVAAVERAKQDEAEAAEILKSIMPRGVRRQKSSLSKSLLASSPAKESSTKEGKEKEKKKKKPGTSNIEKTKEMLRKQSMTRKNEIQDDIKRLEKSKSSGSSSPATHRQLVS
jgi:hypothetical protein